MGTDIALAHVFQGRWLQCIESSENRLVFRERAGVIEILKGWMFIILGGALADLGLYSAFWKQDLRLAIVLLMPTGLLFLAMGAASAFPRKGFGIDTASGRIEVWGLQMLRQCRATFELKNFTRVRISLGLGGNYYVLCLMDSNEAVLPLTRPRLQAEAMALANEIAEALKVSVIEDTSAVDKESTDRFKKALLEKKVFDVA